MSDKLLQKMWAGEALLTLERVKEILTYEPETGVFRWRIARGSNAPAGAVAGSYATSGHWLIRIDGRNYRAHRVAWLYFYGQWPKNYIDHINGVRDDNRISNLRDVTRSVNQQNLRTAQSNSSTGLLGVRAKRAKRVFDASIKVGPERIFLGSFKTAEEAHAVYLEAKRKYHEGCTI